MSAPPLQNLDDLETAFTRGGIPLPPVRGLLTRCRTFFRRYAALEERLLGRVTFTVPEHLLLPRPPEDPVQAVEGLARREARRLAWGGEGGRDLPLLLDRDGLKIYRPRFPDGAGVEGFFLFDRAAGPVFVVDGGFPPETMNALAARLYGHYLLDHDPYGIHLLVPGTAGEDPRALRARHFAASLLVDEEELRSYLAGLGWTPGSPVPPDALPHLVAFFEVDAGTVIARLLFLSLVDPGAVPALAGGIVDPARSEAAGDPIAALPDRFVRLALEAHARGFLTLAELAHHLEGDATAARRLAAQFRLPDGDEPPPSPEPPRSVPRTRRKPDAGRS
jgi:hypothetical protein